MESFGLILNAKSQMPTLQSFLLSTSLKLALGFKLQRILDIISPNITGAEVMATITIFDSVKREKVEFEPIVEKEAKIYVCGPTVYDDAHLGHARSALSFDLLSRTLRCFGFNVTLAKNFTDIDDKIINKLKSTNLTLQELTQYYINRYLDEMEALNVKRADLEPKATESIDAILEMIESLIERGFAYRVEGGDIYFDTSKDESYGKISHMVTDDSQNISRVSHSKTKKNPKDFALWKACEGEESICFDAKIGRGRPGWHIECSAMIDKLFGKRGDYSVDIHAGGADLLFPHHENEATQTRCARDYEIAKYWMHNGFVQIDGEKMSKSLGNSFFLKDALKAYSGEVLRFYLISVHYRNSFNFNELDLLSAKKRLDRLYRLKKRLLPVKVGSVDESFREALLEAMGDDLNSSKALAVVDEMVSSVNEQLDKNPKNKNLKSTTLANIEFIDELLGFGGNEPFEWFQQGVDEVTKEEIESLIQARSDAKKSKNYALADEIREQLSKMGVAVMDMPDGTKWERID
jgi:cysteinyl-tRNA synthetase